MNKVSGKIQAKSWQPTPLPHVQKSGFAVRPFPSLEAQQESQSSHDTIQRRGNPPVVAPNPAVGMLANVNRAIATDSTTEPAGTGMTVQAKLTIGAPGDKYEQEADRVAKQVVQRLQAPATPPVAPPSGDGSEPTVQRQVAIPIMQRVTAGLGGSPGPMPADAGFEAQLQRSRGGGSPLDAAFRAKVEPLMGADFSGVRVHSDGNSDRLARSIQAKAFTTGKDMYFSSGAYEPGSRGGQELLAHELTHVVQQKGNLRTKKSDEGKEIHTTRPAITPLLTINNGTERVQAVFGNTAYSQANATRLNYREELRLHKRFWGAVPNSDRLRHYLILAFADHNDASPNSSVDLSKIIYCHEQRDHYIDNQAHHIVEVGDRDAEEARQILNWAGINIDSPVNGVILPKNYHEDSVAQTSHNGSHTAQYSKSVTNALVTALQNAGYHRSFTHGHPYINMAARQVPVIRTLNSIRRLLIEQAVPINSLVDYTYDPRTETQKNTADTIKLLFNDYINQDGSYNEPGVAPLRPARNMGCKIRRIR